MGVNTLQRYKYVPYMYRVSTVYQPYINRNLQSKIK